MLPACGTGAARRGNHIHLGFDVPPLVLWGTTQPLLSVVSVVPLSQTLPSLEHLGAPCSKSR